MNQRARARLLTFYDHDALSGVFKRGDKVNREVLCALQLMMDDDAANDRNAHLLEYLNVIINGILYLLYIFLLPPLFSGVAVALAARRAARADCALCRGLAADAMRRCRSSRFPSGQSSVLRGHRAGERALRQEDPTLSQHGPLAASFAGQGSRTPPRRT